MKKILKLFTNFNFRFRKISAKLPLKAVFAVLAFILAFYLLSSFTPYSELNLF
jgi:hypothetical protein